SALSLLTNGATAAITNSNTNEIAASITNVPVQTETTSSASTQAGGKNTKKAGGGRIGLWTGLFLVSIIGLGLLIASDVSHFLGNRALKTIYNEEGEGVKNPEYEQAEQVWANGQHLEAIGLMREYLKKNPREQHVALRIAEIYEKDLGNYLAAALEYEEVLKHKLAPDRWGWAAIHLCNLYFKLNQEQKAYELLRRIVKEYPETPAADKARKRLEQVDGSSIEQLATESNVSSKTPAAPPQSGPASNLPPGFRPKK
ncbi:MAG TPA: tetratricopeptide repeat protein, partial [Candidatus Kapabacteria bacterium]|nr:tetratricopeptide repeat protein [Candidatus Kapabacteria bacterium]